MRCTDVQKQLAIDSQLSRLPARVRTHLRECPDCRQAQAIYADIDLQLQEQHAWQPPPGFAERVGSLGLASLSKTSPQKPRRFFQRILDWAVAFSPAPILLGLLAAAFSLLVLLHANDFATRYTELTVAFSRALLANEVQFTWITIILSLGFTAWVTRRVLR